jgi:hypothetical protein
MLVVPKKFEKLMITFAPLFTTRVWHHVLVLLVGAILSPGKRTITAVLRVMGLAHAQSFQQYHRVLNRDVWSGLEGARLLLLLLVSLLAPSGPLVMGLDDTLERRRGVKIHAKGIYRDLVRSSHSHLVKASGLRWLSLMLLVPIAWAKRVWALPFLTVLAPSERYHQARDLRHKKLTDWARQMLLMVRRWVPERALVLVTDSSVAVITLLWRVCQLPNPICCVTRLRLDAALYEPAPPRTPRQTGRPRLKGQRLPTLANVLHDAATYWNTVTVRGWYGKPERVVEITSATAVWYHSGMPPLPIRWVLVRDPHGEFDPQSIAVHRLDGGPRPEPGVVCPPLAPGSDVAGDPGPSGHGDPATVERAGDRPHHASPAGPVLDRHADGRPAGAGARAASETGGMVSQIPANLCRCHRDRAATLVDLDTFLHVTGESRHGGNPLHTAEPLDRYPLLCGMNG